MYRKTREGSCPGHSHHHHHQQQQQQQQQQHLRSENLGGVGGCGAFIVVQAAITPPSRQVSKHSGHRHHHCHCHCHCQCHHRHHHHTGETNV